MSRQRSSLLNVIRVESSARNISTEEGVRTRGREDIDVPPLATAKARAGETGMFEGRRSVEASVGSSNE